ncbi:hypothetical protein TVAG_480230 [Trichomonas vaginalis G3]|uniref:Beige/BEACH domain containing protein n=1 Tax=Trichomonas vaginalis (strain ATCC PRA-98 / G3) TaxID=412133 RepID=A2FK33_TRIV3|nr:aggrephagy protein [Trichomonas vaginalis G3]EAX94742.1 hypothetical protein TVAG_480230 [Trichomonas vaginalis G3]KAI5551720.1 aggrephagy protein [Trichomonas vaginalis G3]|eukprot:XP_001307672.1 hypothetical protein [Trichomonas vaginalis G3]
MDFIRTFFQTQHHPISELLLLWANRSSFIDSTAKDLDQVSPFQFPALDKTKIFAIDMNLISGQTISDSLASLKDKTEWNPDSETIYLNFLKSQTKQSQYFIVVSLLNIICFLIHTELPANFETFDLILSTLIEIHVTDYENHIKIIFKELYARVSKENTSFWPHDSIILLIKFIGIHTASMFNEETIFSDLSYHLPDTFNNTTSKSIIDELLLLIKNIQISNERIFTSPKLVRAIETCVSKIYLPALEILTHLSKNLPENGQIDQFIALPAIVCNYSRNFKQKFDTNFEIKQYPKLKNPTDYDYYKGKSEYFVNGFTFRKTKTLIDVEPLLNLIDDQLATTLIDMIGLIEDVNKNCIKIFLDAFSTLIKNQKSHDGFLNYYICFLYCVSHLSRIISINDYTSAMFHPIIFEQTITIFNEIPDFVDTIRCHVFEVMLTVDPQKIVNIMTNKVNGELFVAECLCRIMSHVPQIDLNFFTENSILRAISSNLRSTQFLRREYPDLFIDPLMSYLCFISKLLSEKEFATICFTNTHFSRILFGLIYDEDISERVITCLTDYLIYSNEITSTYFVGSVFEKIPKNLGEFFVKMIKRSVESNPSISFIVDDWIDSMLDFTITNHSQKALLNTINVILFVVRHLGNDYKFSSLRLSKMITSINENEGNEPTEQTLSLLWSIASQTKSIIPDSMFLIKIPSILVPIFAICHKSQTKQMQFLEKIKELCMSSPSNCVSCHVGQFDLALIDFLTKGEINYRGIVFKPELITDNDIENTVLPLLFAIIQEKSSNCEISKIIDKIVKSDIRLAEFLTKYLSQSINIMKPTFNLCDKQQTIKFSGFDPQKLNDSFSVTFYLKFDQQISSLLPTINIFSLNSKTTQISLILNHASLFFSCTSNVKYSYQCSSALSPNKWVFVTFAAKRITPNKMAWGLYTNTTSSMMSESINTLSFDAETVCEFGQICELNPGLIGRFAMTYKVLSLDDIIYLMSDGESFKNDQFIFTHFDTNVNLFDNDKSFDKTLGRNGNLQKLFSRFDLLDEKIGDLAIGIVKLTFSASLESQKNFASFIYTAGSLETIDSKRLTYQLYLAFYSIGDVISDDHLMEDFLDLIVLNTNIWGRANPSTLMRICNHWSHTVLEQYSVLFQRSGMFQRLIKSFRILFINYGEEFEMNIMASSPAQNKDESILTTPNKDDTSSPLINSESPSLLSQMNNENDSPLSKNQNESDSLISDEKSEENYQNLNKETKENEDPRIDQNDSLEPKVNEVSETTSQDQMKQKENSDINDEEISSPKQNEIYSPDHNNELSTPSKGVNISPMQSSNESPQRNEELFQEISSDNESSSEENDGEEKPQKERRRTKRRQTFSSYDELPKDSSLLTPQKREKITRIGRISSTNIKIDSPIKISESYERLDEDISRARVSYSKILMNTPITAKVEAEFLLSLASFNNPALKEVLKIITVHAKEIASFDVSKPKVPDFLLPIINESNDIEIITNAVIAMAFLKPSDISLLIAAKMISTKTVATDILNNLLTKLPNIPGIAEFLSSLCLSLAPDKVKEDETELTQTDEIEIQRKVTMTEKIKNSLRIGRSRKVSDITGTSPRRFSFLSSGNTTNTNQFANLFSASYRIMTSNEDVNFLLQSKGVSWPFLPLAMLTRIADNVAGQLIEAVSFVIKKCQNPSKELNDAIITIKILEFITKKDLSRFCCNLVLLCKDIVDDFSADMALFIRILDKNITLSNYFDDSPFKETIEKVTQTIIRSMSDIKIKDSVMVYIGCSLTESRDVYDQLCYLCHDRFRQICREIANGADQMTELTDENIAQLKDKALTKIASLLVIVDGFSSKITTLYDDNLSSNDIQNKKFSWTIEFRLLHKVQVDSSIFKNLILKNLPQKVTEKCDSKKYFIGNCIPHMKKYIINHDIDLIKSKNVLLQQTIDNPTISSPCLLLEKNKMKSAAFVIVHGENLVIQIDDYYRIDIHFSNIILVLRRSDLIFEIFSRNDSFLVEFSNNEISDSFYEIFQKFTEKTKDIVCPDNFEKHVFDLIIQNSSIHSEDFRIDGLEVDEFSGKKDLKKSMLLRQKYSSSDNIQNYFPSTKQIPENIRFTPLTMKIVDEKVFYLVEKTVSSFDLFSSEINKYNFEEESTFFVFDNQIFKRNYDENHVVLFSNNNVILLVEDDTKLSILYKNCNNHFNEVISLPERIVCASYCGRTSTISIGLSSCHIMMMSSDGTDIFNVIHFDEEPLNVFSTEVFSLLCVQTSERFYAFDCNGNEVYQMSVKSTFARPFSVNSCDFVLICERGRIFSVNLIDHKIIEIARERDVIDISFNIDKMLIIIVNSSGLIHEVPFIPSLE